MPQGALNVVLFIAAILLIVALAIWIAAAI
jgi:hypothetical protein